MRRNKKGALELSITAIVVLIIAITLLGLAIFFINNMFKGGTELIGGEFAKIKDQLRKNMEDSGELVVMDKGTELEVKRGSPFPFHIGVRNNAPQTRCFRISIGCVKAFNTEECISGGQPNVQVGGRDADNNRPASGENWFPSLLSEFEVPGGDISVSPATMQIANANPDTYLMKLYVYQGETDCEEGADCCGATSTWSTQTKPFHIILS